MLALPQTEADDGAARRGRADPATLNLTPVAVADEFTGYAMFVLQEPDSQAALGEMRQLCPDR